MSGNKANWGLRVVVRCEDTENGEFEVTGGSVMILMIAVVCQACSLPDEEPQNQATGFETEMLKWDSTTLV